MIRTVTAVVTLALAVSMGGGLDDVALAKGPGGGGGGGGGRGGGGGGGGRGGGGFSGGGRGGSFGGAGMSRSFSGGGASFSRGAASPSVRGPGSFNGSNSSFRSVNSGQFGAAHNATSLHAGSWNGRNWNGGAWNGHGWNGTGWNGSGWNGHNNWHGQNWNNWHGNNWWYHNYYNNNWWPFFGYAALGWGSPFGWGYGYNYWPYDGYYSSPSVSYSAYPDYGVPGYANVAPQVANPEPVPQPDNIAQQPQQANANSAVVDVTLPDPNAQLWIGGVTTAAKGNRRQFTSPPLEPGYTYWYNVKASWMQDGERVTLERQVTLTAQGRTAVDFTRPPGGGGQGPPPLPAPMKKPKDQP